MEPFEIPGVVVIDKTSTLGIGSYGAVYKAKVGQLPCAAKILHPTLFHIGDPGPGSDRMRTLFERECRVLRQIRHPHIIQFIKSYQDEDSHLPVLLMELMDESLTHYLESLRTDVPHHIRLNISHDISLALEFLHSIGVLHRDLSSNNVLLIANKRAKVTDFGMAKMWDGNVRQTPATFCPGTMAYMPPEAFKAEPNYTDRLDCFSAGVIFLQILTRRFPKPGNRVRPLQNDERFEMKVPERERRQADIALVAEDNPLLLIALDCIQDRAILRPSASEICGRMEALKSTSWSEYVVEQERRASEGRVGSMGEEEEENGIDTERARVLEHQLDETRGLLQASHLRLEEVQCDLTEKEREVNELRKKLAKIDKEHREKMDNITESVREKQEMLMTHREKYEQAEEIVASKDTRIAGLLRQVRDYQEQLQQKTTLSLPEDIGSVQRTHSASDISSLPHSHSLGSPHPLELKWRLEGTARRIEGHSAAVYDYNAYFTDGNSVLMFNSITGDWTTLPPCHKHSFAISVVGGLPTAIGGFKEGEGNVCNLLSYSAEEHNRVWKKTFPSMKYCRTCPAAVTTANLLVVAGGYGTEENGRCVEVLNRSTMSWSTASPLPFPMWRASMVTCGNKLYIGGGDKEGKPLGCADVLCCSLSDLLSSHSAPTSHTSHSSLPSLRVPKKIRQQFRFTSSSSSGHKVWTSFSKLPSLQSTLVSFQGHLYAVGGQSADQNTPVADVYYYSSLTNEWCRSSHMIIPRSRCFAVALSTNQLMVLGGSIEPYTLTDSFEIAQIIL